MDDSGMFLPVGDLASNPGRFSVSTYGFLRACLARLRLLQKQLRLWLLRMSGSSRGAEALLKNVW
jgi:hypothetical protein